MTTRVPGTRISCSDANGHDGRWRRARPATAALVVVALIASGGCAGPQVPTQPAGTESATPAVAESATPTVPDPVGPITLLLQQREEQRREIHDATELVIVDCMAERGFSYTPAVYPGTLGDPAEWAGLTQHQIDQWTLALLCADIPPETIVGPDPITDPTILVAKGPNGTVFFRSDACTKIGSTAVYGDLVKWYTVELEVDHLANQAFEESNGDKQRRAEIETELADANRASIDQFTRLQNAAINTARTMLAEQKSPSASPTSSANSTPS